MKTSSGRTLLSGALLGLLSVPALAQVSGWGASDNLQLLSQTNSISTPTALTSLGSPVALAAGDQSAYALYANGTVSAWGNNGGGQLGHANNGAELPSTVLGLPPIAKIFAGGFNAYALTPSGELWGWGFNGYGELGSGAAGSTSTPVSIGQVGADSKIIAGDSRAFLLKSDGTLYGAGYNYNWDLAQGDRGNRATFTPIPGISNVRSAAFGGVRAAIASTADGRVYTWGGSPYFAPYYTPTLEPGLSNIVKVAAVNDAAYAVDASGTVFSWGSNENGRLGRPDVIEDYTPTAIPGLPPVADLSTSRDGTVFALARDGSVWSWGNGYYGSIGDGASVSRTAPKLVTGLPSVTSIVSGRGFVLTQSVPAIPAALQSFSVLEASSKGYRNVRAKVTLDRPAGVGGVRVSLASRQVGAILPHGLVAQAYNGLTLTDIPSPRPTLKKVWRIRNRTNSTHNYQMIVLGVPDVIRGTVPAGCDAYFVSNTLPGCLNISLLLDDTNHISLDVAGNATGPVPTNVFASVALPAEVVVPEGQTSAEFDFFANEVPIDSSVEIVATQGTVSKISALKILLESARPTP